MKYRLFHFVTFGLLTIATSPLLQARTWTSAEDSSKRFEAEYIGFEDNIVKVRLESGTQASFPLDTLSKADRDFVLGKDGAEKSKGKKIDVLGVLKNNLVTVIEGKAKPFAFKKGKEPAYVLLYVSAYW